MLQESGISERQQNFLDRIVGSAQRCQKIVQSLLSFSRRRQPERKIVSLNELIQTTVELSRYELKAINIEITMNLSPDIPPVSVDPAQIQQVFVNILNNGAHAIQEKGKSGGNIRITTKLVAGKARIEFADNGCGIPKEHLDKIFNPFFTTKPVGEGTGLGLSLTYGIIHEHGGTIVAESVAGQGATFTIDLPVTHSTQTSAVPPLPERAAISNQPNGSRKILVIDDEENILELIQEVLTTTGHRVELATTGSAALQLVRNGDYDLIICDWKIPGMNGKEIYAELQKIDPAKARKFLFVTGNVLSPETEQFLRVERAPYLLKPFSVTQLRKTVETLLNASV
jgi:two-component system NtrC family sensor kinase